jgi:hypothetical protein
MTCAPGVYALALIGGGVHARVQHGHRLKLTRPDRVFLWSLGSRSLTPLTCVEGLVVVADQEANELP